MRKYFATLLLLGAAGTLVGLRSFRAAQQTGTLPSVAEGSQAESLQPAAAKSSPAVAKPGQRRAAKSNTSSKGSAARKARKSLASRTTTREMAQRGGAAASGEGTGNGEQETIVRQGPIPPPDLTAHDRAFNGMGIEPVAPRSFDGDVRTLPPAARKPRVEVELEAPFNYKSQTQEARQAALALDAPNTFPALL